MAQTEAQKRAVRKYQEEHTQQLLLRLNRRTDADVISRLEAQPSKAGYIKQLVREDMKGERKMIKLSLEAGTSRHGDHGVNYLLGCDGTHTLYAETPVPDGCSDDYGYMALKADILKQAEERGLPADSLSFWYDGQEDMLEEDARADCEIQRW